MSEKNHLTRSDTMKKLALLTFLTTTLFVGAFELTIGSGPIKTDPVYTQAYWECMARCISPGNECHELCSSIAENAVLISRNPG